MTPAMALAVRPVKAIDTPVETTDDGARLTIPLTADRLGFWGRLFKLPEGATKTFELDEVGLFVWNHIDGKATVRHLAHSLSKQWQLDERSAEVATLQFLNMLAAKGLVGVKKSSKAGA